MRNESVPKKGKSFVFHNWLILFFLAVISVNHFDLNFLLFNRPANHKKRIEMIELKQKI